MTIIKTLGRKQRKKHSIKFKISYFKMSNVFQKFPNWSAYNLKKEKDEGNDIRNFPGTRRLKTIIDHS